MKFVRKIFFTRGLYNSPGTFAGLCCDLPDSFYEVLLINFGFLAFNIFGIFTVKIMKFGRKIFFDIGLYNHPGISAWLFRRLSWRFLRKIGCTSSIFIINGFLAHFARKYKNDGLNFYIPSMGGCQLYESLRRKPGCGLLSGFNFSLIIISRFLFGSLFEVANVFWL